MVPSPVRYRGAGLDVHPLGVVGVEDQVGPRLGQVEGLDVGGPGAGRLLVRPRGDGEGRARLQLFDVLAGGRWPTRSSSGRSSCRRSGRPRSSAGWPAPASPPGCPGVARTPVSRDLAKPRNPPTPVAAGGAGGMGRQGRRRRRSGCSGVSTGEESPDDEGKMSEVDTFGAGQHDHQQRRPPPPRPVPATPRVSQGTPRVPAIDCHMATSPQMPKATQATT